MTPSFSGCGRKSAESGPITSLSLAVSVQWEGHCVPSPAQNRLFLAVYIEEVERGG